jgi:hypothetical protein
LEIFFLLNEVHPSTLKLYKMSKHKNQSSNTSNTENNVQDEPQPPAKHVNTNKYSGMEAEQALGELLDVYAVLNL